jgi:hypothetical protein
MRDHTLRDRGELTFHDILLGAALVPALVLLAVPFVPIPGDHETEMKVKVSDGDDNSIRRFSAPTYESVCAQVKLAIANQNPTSGAYTKIKC